MKVLNTIQGFDEKLMSCISLLRRSWLNKPMQLLTMSGYSYSWFVLFLALGLTNYFRINFLPEQGLFFRCLYAPFFAWISGIFIKLMFKRKRPSTPNLEVLDGHVKDKSFPSSHTSASVAFGFVLLLCGHPLGWLVALWALLVSVSRYYVGVHYPSDILAGGVLGVVCAYLALSII